MPVISRNCSIFFLLASSFLAPGSPAASVESARAPAIVASIAPVQALVSGVMEGVSASALLVPANLSPHDFSLRPSHVRALENADIVFLIDRNFELFLAKPLAALSPAPQIVELSRSEGIRLLPARALEEDKHEADEHHHLAMDYHLWLNPEFAAAMTHEISKTLSRKDPAHARQYRSNAMRMAGALEKLDRELRDMLAFPAPRDYAPYMALHDAYHYFEARYGLPAPPRLMRDPEAGIRAGHLAMTERMFAHAPPHCIFAEPQYDEGVARQFAKKYQAEIVTLRPDSAGEKADFASYLDFLRMLGQRIKTCSTPKG